MMTEQNRREVERCLRGAVTVAELRNALDGYPDDARVVFVCDYGDYSHTQQALPVREVTTSDEEGTCLAPSAYSQSGLAMYEDDPDDDGGAGPPAPPAPFVIFR
jgi:hypothetical protein